MLAEALQKIADMAKTELYDMHDRSLSSRPLFNMPLPDEPRYPTLEFATLAGFAEFAGKKLALAGADSQIVVKATSVEFNGPPFGVNRRRDVFAQVKCDAAPFLFANYADLETFRVDLLTRFIQSPDRAAIVDFISKINDEAIKTLVDSGVTQQMTAKVGIASFGTVEVPCPVQLEPIRTFVEIEQPAGTFIFRMRKGHAGPEAALFEIFTDWQRTAVERIKAHLQTFAELKAVAIYA